jgi:hypothetical protein
MMLSFFYMYILREMIFFMYSSETSARILQKYDLEDKSEAIYNIDEKGLPTEHKPPDIVTGKNSGGQSITSPKDKITTVIGAGSAIDWHDHHTIPNDALLLLHVHT